MENVENQTDLSRSLEEFLKKRKSFSERKVNDKVLLIDGTNNFIRCGNAFSQANAEGNEIGAVIGFMRTMSHAIDLIKPTRCVIAFDGKGGSFKRRELYSEYKNKKKCGWNFAKREDVFEKNEDQDDFESAIRQFAILNELLENLPLTIGAVEMIESDDFIAWAVKELKEKFNSECVIMSTDKDFLQLVDERTAIWSPIKKMVYDSKNFKKEFGLTPTNYLLHRTILGDASDNLPKAKGVGEKNLKKALPLLFEEKNLSIDELIAEIEKLPGKNQTEKKLKNSIEMIKINYKLMKLDDSMISLNAKEKIKEILKTKNANRLNKDRFVDVLKKRNLMIGNETSRIDKWISMTFGALDFYLKREISE